MYATGPQVLFEDGKPSRWLFTSKKTGEVMKKTVEHTNHLSIKVRRRQQGTRTTHLRCDHGLSCC